MSNADFFNESILSYIDSCRNIEIPEKRKLKLNRIIDYIDQKKKCKQPINLIFVCTHNSRRSHLSQIWAQVMASYFDVKGIYCYSGGTEVTRIYDSVIKALKDVGFEIESKEHQNNPIYFIRFAENLPAITGFSKRFDDHFNPKKEFVSVMTCTDADQNCPIILGCDQRMSLPYEDPKKFDNTSEEMERYHERMLQIASEMYYVFSSIVEKDSLT